MRIGLLSKNININYFKYIKVFFAISLILFIASIVSFIVKPFNLGIDFKGGIVIDVKYNGYITDEIININTILRNNKINASIKTFNSNNYQVSVSLKEINNQQDTIKLITNVLTAHNYSILQQQFVGPTVSKKLISGAINAIIFSLIGIFVYIYVRFNWQFGILAVIALIHDFIISLFFVNIFNFSLDISSIAAVLTIIGYSINDTVVLFDQVRENIKKHIKESTQSIINRSINQALSRSIATSATLLLVIIPIFIFGQESLKTFSFLLFIGVTIGTYSSIIIATPLLKYLGNIKNKELKKQTYI